MLSYMPWKVPFKMSFLLLNDGKSLKVTKLKFANGISRLGFAMFVTRASLHSVIWYWCVITLYLGFAYSTLMCFIAKHIPSFRLHPNLRISCIDRRVSIIWIPCIDISLLIYYNNLFYISLSLSNNNFIVDTYCEAPSLCGPSVWFD